MKAEKRCPWCLGSPEYIAYHDREWGGPVHDDRVLFEFLILEGAQAGLSWSTILAQARELPAALRGLRPGQGRALHARRAWRSCCSTPGIVRNRLKVEGTVKNAKAFLAVQKEFGSFDAYVWRFVGGKPLVNRPQSMKDVPGRPAPSPTRSRRT